MTIDDKSAVTDNQHHGGEYFITRCEMSCTNVPIDILILSVCVVSKASMFDIHDQISHFK